MAHRAHTRLSRLPAFLAAAVLATATLTSTLAVAVAGAPQARPVDDFGTYQPQVSCDPHPKPGVVAARDLLRAKFGGGDYGIVRACHIGGLSEHKEGRAWDWALNAYNHDDRRIAAKALNWLTKTVDGQPAANARKLGISYIIWDRKMWRAYDHTRGWAPYTGASPHTDHIHISFTWNGATAQTSYWTGQPMPFDYGPCPLWVGEMAEPWRKPRLTPCPTPIRRPVMHRNGTYTAQAGESVGRVARFFDRDRTQIRAWNQYPPGPVTIPSGTPVRVVPTADAQGHYPVQPGDKVRTIAGYFPVTGTQIREWNQFPATGRVRLKPGQTVQVVSPVTAPSDPTINAGAPIGSRR